MLRRDVALWRGAEQALVFSAELRRALVADGIGGFGDSLVFGYHKPLAFVEAQIFLILYGAYGSHFPEMPVSPVVLMIDMLPQAGSVCFLSLP